MAEGVVFAALETIRSLLQEEAKFLSGMSSQVKGLESQLKEMQCLLEDAYRRRHESKTIANWIAEIKDLAYRSEDVIETYAVHVSSRGGLRRKLLGMLSCGFKFHKIASEITDIKRDISRVYNSMQELYGIRSIIIPGEDAAADENKRLKRLTCPFERDDCFVGMEDDLKRLVALILDDDKHTRVISVWGMGGIGKTTIARKIYNHDKIKYCFDSFAWVCITQKCRVRSVMEEVLVQLVPRKKEGITHMSFAELIEQLCEVQREKRCLIVLDDLWKVDHWDCLKDVFDGVGIKSKILLTTRKQNVVDLGLSFELGLLKVDDGWELLKRKAFQGNHVHADFGPEKELFEEVGKKMVQKCGYLPLVISLLGGILSKKKSLKDWDLVNKNIDSYLFDGGSIEDNKIHEIVLELSYEDLPSYLKPCFLYMGQFGEDQCIYGDNLYMLWIAEGLVSPENRRNNETLMDIAELYLSELVSRCIVQVVVNEAMSNKRYISCHLHDVVRELCLSKGKLEDFRLKVVDCPGGKMDLFDSSLLDTMTRHLSVHFRGEVDLEHSECTHDQRYVRSLKFLNHLSWRKIDFPDNVLDFRKTKLVRVLVFEGCSFQRRRIPSEIGNLIHLRYLRLRNCELDELPPSIGNLIYLYALDLFHSCDVKLPNVLNKMLRLKHLFLPDYQKNNTRNYELKLEGLNKLETLIGFNSLVHDLKFVSKMNNLQRLQATLHDNKALSKIIDNINTKWKDLRESALIIKEGCYLTSTQDGVGILNKVLTCPNLHSLWIDVNIKNFANICRETQTIFPSVMLLTLRNCEIEDDPMEILEKLPSLESLCLWPSSYVGQEIICNAMGFRQLKTLQLWGLPNLREWRVENGAMANLCELEISDCPKLDMVPEGLRFISSLEELEISEVRGGGKKVSAKKRGFQQYIPCSFRHRP